MQRTLEAAGFETQGAEDGLRAAALLAEQAFEVIVSDVSMPGMDGPEVLRMVRRRDLDVPVILVSGAPTLERRFKPWNTGPSATCKNPLAGGVLVEAVKEATTLHQARRLRREAVALLGRQDKQLGDRVARGCLRTRAGWLPADCPVGGSQHLWV